MINFKFYSRFTTEFPSPASVSSYYVGPPVGSPYAASQLYVYVQPSAANGGDPSLYYTVASSLDNNTWQSSPTPYASGQPMGSGVYPLGSVVFLRLGARNLAGTTWAYSQVNYRAAPVPPRSMTAVVNSDLTTIVNNQPLTLSYPLVAVDVSIAAVPLIGGWTPAQYAVLLPGNVTSDVFDSTSFTIYLPGSSSVVSLIPVAIGPYGNASGSEIRFALPSTYFLGECLSPDA